VQRTGGCEFGRASSQMGQSPTCNFVGLRRSSREGRKEGEGGFQGAFIGGLGVGRGLGLGLDCIGRLGGVVQERDGIQGRKETPTGGVHLSAGGGDGTDTLSGRRDSWPGPNSGLGQNRPPPPRPFILFFYFFSFYFSVF
jgi:hypothetical protein